MLDQRSAAIACARLLMAVIGLACDIPAAWAQGERLPSGQHRVLVMHSARRDAPAPVTMDQVIQRVLGHQLHGRLDYYSESIDSARFPDSAYRDAFRTFLQHKYADRRFDVIIAAGDEVLELLSTPGFERFADVPVVYHASRAARRVPRSTGVTAPLDLSRTIAMAISLQPDIRQVIAISGASPFDRWYETLARDQLRRFDGQLEIVYWSGLERSEMLERVAAVPAGTILYPLMLTEDGRGQRFLPLEALEEIVATANVPVYAWASPEMDRGVVGGSLISLEVVAGRLADLALRVLAGEKVENIPVQEIDANVDEVDWRQLQRWGISEARVPAGTAVRFREPTLWSQYRSYIIGAIVLVSLQTLLIAALLTQRVRRRRSEAALRRSYQQNKDLAGRLITAQEAERTRIARDLHDDISQQLAGVSIAFSGLRQRLGGYPISGELQQELADLQQQTLALARNVRHLSHDLHPTVLQHLGLVKGLTAYCSQLDRAHGVTIRCTAEGDFATMSPDAALCVYRIAQEALRNVIAHAGASRADVQLRRDGDHVEITILDDGRGFDAAGGVERSTGLGLVSITERAKIAGGSLDIVTGAARGTRVQARIPASPRAQGSSDQRTHGQVA